MLAASKEGRTCFGRGHFAGVALVCAATAVLSFAAFDSASVAAAQETKPATSIRVRIDNDNRPFEFLDASGAPAGFDVDLLRAIADTSGMTVEFVAGPRDTAVQELVRGSFDVVGGVCGTKQLAEQVDLGTPHMLLFHALFVPAGSPIKSENDLAGKSIIVCRGSVMHDYALGFSDNVVPVGTVEDAIALLATGAYDCALLLKDMGEHAIERTKPGNLSTTGVPVLRTGYSYAVRKGNTELLGRLDTGLSAVLSSGKYKEIQGRWFTVYDYPLRRVGLRVLSIGGPLLLIMLVLSVCMVLWSRGIRRRVALATKELRAEAELNRQNEEKTKAEKQKLIEILRNAPYGVAVLGGTGWTDELLYMNHAATELSGYSIENAPTIEKLAEIAFPDAEYRERLRQRWEDLGKGELRNAGFTVSATRRAGEKVHVDFRATKLADGRVMVMFCDVTDKYVAEEERQRLEERMRQSQKLEAMGQLAGGVAHDFNNILTPILGNAQLLQMDLDGTPDHKTLLDQIVNAAKRAADLTRQLLAYARKGKFQIVPVDIHDTIREVTGLMQHSVNRLIEVQQDLKADKRVIMGDPSQLQNALLNLGLNARDAMPKGGVLTFATRTISLDKESSRRLSYDVAPGEYLEIRVADTGLGMSPEVRARIFEPFFTTKKPGEGTGLGLSAVYGCVKNHHGTVHVQSEQGKGTTFTILFPTVGGDGDTSEAAAAAVPDQMVHGIGHILLVDDEASVRRFTSKALQKMGYRVSTCSDGQQAVEFYKEHHAEIDLVVMDLIMPNMDGRMASHEMRQINKDVRVLVASGYADETTAVECMREGAMDFIAKPFRLEELSQAVAMYIRR